MRAFPPKALRPSLYRFCWLGFAIIVLLWAATARSQNLQEYPTPFSVWLDFRRLADQHQIARKVFLEPPLGVAHQPHGLIELHSNRRHRAIITQSGLGKAWSYRDFVNTPDQRYRDIVARFVAAGYAKAVKDEYT